MRSISLKRFVTGAALCALATALASEARADDDASQNLHLGGTPSNTVVPNAGLLVASDGNFYGTTQGYNDVNGTVFELSADGATYTTIYPFTGNQRVVAGLAEGPDGALYGTIYSGQAPVAQGAVFKVTKSGVYATVHAFSGTDGQTPAGPLLIASDGTIYGTTNGGGASAGNSSGTVFSIDPAGNFTTLYDFSTHDHTIYGVNPRSRLVFGVDGTIYGTTTTGGTSNRGTIFALAVDNSLDAVSLDSTIGFGPHDLLLACDGFIYGRAFGGNGVIFKMDPSSGTLSVLHGLSGNDGKFDYNSGDGNASGGALIQGINGSLFGVAQHGGSHNGGTVFEVALDGTFSVHVNSTEQPWGLIQGGNANLFGTAAGNNSIWEDDLADGEKVAATCALDGGSTGGGGGSGSGGAQGTGGATGTTSGAGGGAATGNSGGSTGSGPTDSGGTSGTGGAAAGGGDATGAGGSGSPGASKSGGGGCSLGGPVPTGGAPLAVTALLALSVAAARRRRGRRA